MTKDVNLMPSDVAIAPTKKKRKKIASLEKRKSRSGWIFVLPFVLGFLLVYLPMIYDSLVLTFNQSVTVTLKDVNGMSYTTTQLEWVGFQNYIDAFTKDNSGFASSLLDGLQDLALDVPCILIFSLFMAILLNQKMAGRAVFRAIFFVPVVLATGVMETFLQEDPEALESIDTGAGSGAGGATTAGGEEAATESSGGILATEDVAALFGSFSVGQSFITFITNLVNDIYNIVNRSGVQMLIFLAGLQSVSPAIYESCKIDGASSWETFWKITLPILSPMILVNAIYTIIDAFTTNTNVVMTYINGVTSNGNFKERQNEVSTAMSWVYFMVVALIVAIIAAVFSAFVFYQRKSD